MEATSTKFVMPGDLNPGGTLFGGQMMAWMDKVAAMCALRRTRGQNVVTAKVEEINFKLPAFQGDQIRLTACIENEGRSSMRIYVGADKIDITKNPIKYKGIADSVFHMVQVDDYGKAKPLDKSLTLIHGEK